MSSVSVRGAGWLAIASNFSITAIKEGLSASAERMPVIRAGTPADRLVVEVCSLIRFMVRFLESVHIQQQVEPRKSSRG
jgi:hypothetical protein